MMEEITLLTKNDTLHSAKIHAEGMPNDFLPSFGMHFLQKLHESLLTVPSVVALGFRVDNQLVGIIFATTDTKSLMKTILPQKGLSFLPFILRQIIKNPITIKYLFQTIFYGKNSHDDLDTELIILSVAQGFRHQGIGKKLIEFLAKNLSDKEINSFKVGTLSTNVPANNFYKKMGGNFSYSFSIYDRKWNVYIYDLKNRFKFKNGVNKYEV